MTDSKYFTTTKKGEIFELKSELNSDKKERKREAVKKVIASMTVGKDVSALFPDVINCMQTDNLELKKLVYLYLMNYAKAQPDLAIMAVNTFVKDCEDPNPLIRALAVRTMGCIRVDKITEYLCEPLRKCLKVYYCFSLFVFVSVTCMVVISGRGSVCEKDSRRGRGQAA